MIAAEPHPTVLWELTRLCDVHCRGCPSGASEQRDPNELSTYEAYKTIDQIAALQPRELTITGGDPLERDDVDQIVDYARRRGLDPALVLTASRKLTFDAIDALRANGLTRAVFSIDGSTAAIHESLHGVGGTFAATLRAVRAAERAGLRIEMNTLVTRRNAGDLEAIVELPRPLSIERWNVHFVVPIGASRQLEMLTAAEVEQLFATLDAIRARERFTLRVVEAPHYRRFRLQQILAARLAGDDDVWSDSIDRAHSSVYISHSGEVRPSEFAPHSAGNLRFRPLGDIYRGSDLFVALRNPENLRGKCRECDYRTLCGGSRARAYAMTGDLFGADPLCAYEPGRGGAMPVVRHGKEIPT